MGHLQRYSLYPKGESRLFPCFLPAGMHCGDPLNRGSPQCISLSRWEIKCLTELHYPQSADEFLPAQETLLCTWPWPLTSWWRGGKTKIECPHVDQYSITWHQGHPGSQNMAYRMVFLIFSYDLSTVTRLPSFILHWSKHSLNRQKGSLDVSNLDTLHGSCFYSEQFTMNTSGE